MKKSIISILGAVLSVSVVSAQTGQVNITPLQNLLGGAQSLVSQAVPLLIGVAMVTFFYGLVMFIWKGKEGGDTLEKSKQFMLYSIGAMFVMVSIWGIIALLQSMLGVQNMDTIRFPKAFPGQ